MSETDTSPPTGPGPDVTDALLELSELIKTGIRRDGQTISRLRAEIARLARYQARLEWLHTGGDRDADGCEWGVYRVKWNELGQPVEVWQTNSDFSDLDAEMRREAEQTNQVPRLTPLSAAADPGFVLGSAAQTQANATR